MSKRWILAGVLATLWTASTSMAGGTCNSNSDCNDLNPCTQDVCQIILPPIGVCVHAPLSGNTCADDGNVCTSDKCSNGACTHPANNGVACSNDGNECTNDVCSNSQCTHTPRGGSPCTDDGNECTNDVCNGSLCAHPPVATGTACDDSNACTDADKCNSSGQCAGTPIPGCGGGPCPLEIALDATPQRDGALGVLRNYRDVVLGGSVAGRGYTDLYYFHADEVGGILQASPALRRDVAVTLLRLAPDIQTVLDGGDVVLTPAEVETVDRLLETVQRQASDELAQDIQNVRQTLQKGGLTDVFGVRVEDARPRRR